MLGEELLVAPVLEKGAVNRDIYLPSGTWREVLRPREGLFHGPVWIRNHPAPIDHLPFFELVQPNKNIDNNEILG
jgi:alpha-glucosidase (family GH31 glycosyl hydrolase)